MSWKRLKLWEDFVPDYHHVKFGGDLLRNKQEMQRGILCVLQPMFYQKKTPAGSGLTLFELDRDVQWVEILQIDK